MLIHTIIQVGGGLRRSSGPTSFSKQGQLRGQRRFLGALSSQVLSNFRHGVSTPLQATDVKEKCREQCRTCTDQYNLVSKRLTWLLVATTTSDKSRNREASMELQLLGFTVLCPYADKGQYHFHFTQFEPVPSSFHLEVFITIRHSGQGSKSFETECSDTIECHL